MNLNRLLCWQCMKNKSKLSIIVKVRSMWQCFKNRFSLVFWNVFMTSQIFMFLRRCAPSSGGNATCSLVFGLYFKKKNVAIYLINVFFLSLCIRSQQGKSLCQIWKSQLKWWMHYVIDEHFNNLLSMPTLLKWINGRMRFHCDQNDEFNLSPFMLIYFILYNFPHGLSLFNLL